VTICITADGKTLESQVNPSFGRAPYFLFLVPGMPEVEAVENTPGAHGAGVQAAQTVANKGASDVITGNVGPNAYQALSAAGIQVHVGATGTVKKAVEDFCAGLLTRTESPTSRRHGGGGRR
jgi:predicted Fe-Mo cluster-binding NifX family protein